MDTAAAIAPIIDCATGSTSRGELWLELLLVDSDDERDAVEVAVPVWVDCAGEGELDWADAHYHGAACGVLLSRIPAGLRAAIVAAQRAGVVPSDDALVEAWDDSGGREARAEWRLDMAI